MEKSFIEIRNEDAIARRKKRDIINSYFKRKYFPIQRKDIINYLKRKCPPIHCETYYLIDSSK